MRNFFAVSMSPGEERERLMVLSKVREVLALLFCLQSKFLEFVLFETKDLGLLTLSLG